MAASFFESKFRKFRKFLDIDITLDVGQLFDLTGVPPEKQKITAGAKQIKDDTDLRAIGLKANQVCRMLLNEMHAG